MSWKEIFILLFVTVGPVRPTMAFFALTQSIDSGLRRSIAIRAVSIAALILVIMFFLGAGLLNNWQVSVNALLIAGGAVLFLSAIQLVLGDEKQPASDAPPPAPTLETAIFPLSTPTIVTPHGLVAIVAIEASMQSVTDHLILFALIMVVMAINLVFLLNANRILAKVPVIVLKIIVRILGVLLAAMAVQFMIFGFSGLGLIPNA